MFNNLVFLSILDTFNILVSVIIHKVLHFEKKTRKLLTNELLFVLFQGTLKGFDQTVNLILDESHERVFSSGSGVEQVMLGLYIIRGDNM